MKKSFKNVKHKRVENTVTKSDELVKKVTKYEKKNAYNSGKNVTKSEKKWKKWRRKSHKKWKKK